MLLLAAPAFAQRKVARPRRVVRWRKNYEDALSQARRTDRPVFVYAYLRDHPASVVFLKKLLADVRFQRLSRIFIMVRVDVRRRKDLMGKLDVQRYPSAVLLDSAGERIYKLERHRTPAEVVRYMVRTILIAMHNSGKRLKEAGRVRLAVIKFKWVLALAPGTPPAKWSAREMRRIAADGIKKLSQAAIAKDANDYVKTMSLLDELVYEYRSVGAGRQAVRAMLKLLKVPRAARAYKEVIRRQFAERKLRYARRLDKQQNMENALIVYWDVTRNYAKTPSAEVAAKRAAEIAAGRPELVTRASKKRQDRDCRLWMEMAKAFAINKRKDRALAYYNRILKYYADTPWAEKAKAERDRLLTAAPTR